MKNKICLTPLAYFINLALASLTGYVIRAVADHAGVF